MMKAIPNQPPTSFVTFHLNRAHNQLSAQAAFLLKSKADISLVEWRIIQLMQMLDLTSMSKLAKEVDMDKGQLSRKIKSMAAKGLVTSDRDDEDHRQYHLVLTAKSKALIDDIAPMMQKRQRLLLQDISEQDLGVFYKVLNRISDAADQREIE